MREKIINFLLLWRKYNAVIFSLFLCSMFFLVLGGFRQFIVWPQITKFFYHHSSLYDADVEEISSRNPPYKMGKLTGKYSKNTNSQEKLELGKLVHNSTSFTYLTQYEWFNVHFLRAYLMLPTIYLGHLFGVSHHFVFSILIIVLIAIIAALMQRIYELNEGGLFSGSLFLLLLSLMAFTSMNGRMIWGFLGISLAIYVFEKIHLLKFKTIFFLTLAALLFSSISTGVLFFIFLLLFIYPAIAMALRRISMDKIKPILPSLLIFLYPVTLSFNKNFSFFGGDFLSPFRALESHGILPMIIGYWYYFIPLLFIALYASYYILKSRDISLVLRVSLFLFLLSGLLGRGVFSLTLVPFILIFSILLDKKIKAFA